MFTVLQNPLVTYFSRITLLTLTVHGHVSFFGVNRESYFVFKKLSHSSSSDWTSFFEIWKGVVLCTFREKKSWMSVQYSIYNGKKKKTVCIWPPRFKKGLYQMFAQFILLLQRNVSNSPDICVCSSEIRNDIWFLRVELLLIRCCLAAVNSQSSYFRSLQICYWSLICHSFAR